MLARRLEKGANSVLAISTRQIPFAPAPDPTWLPTIRTFWELFRWICEPHQHDFPATSVLFPRTTLLRIVASQLISWRIPGPEFAHYEVVLVEHAVNVAVGPDTRSGVVVDPVATPHDSVGSGRGTHDLRSARVPDARSPAGVRGVVVGHLVVLDQDVTRRATVDPVAAVVMDVIASQHGAPV